MSKTALHPERKVLSMAKRSDGWRYHKDDRQWVNLDQFYILFVRDGNEISNSQVVGFPVPVRVEMILHTATTREECEKWLEEFMNQ